MQVMPTFKNLDSLIRVFLNEKVRLSREQFLWFAAFFFGVVLFPLEDQLFLGVRWPLLSSRRSSLHLSTGLTRCLTTFVSVRASA